MRARLLAAAAVLAFAPAVARADDDDKDNSKGPVGSISSDFNNKKIAKGDTIWFSAVCRVRGVPDAGAKVWFSESTITFKVGGVTQTLAVPSSLITFSATATKASATFDNASQTWLVTVPARDRDDVANDNDEDKDEDKDRDREGDGDEHHRNVLLGALAYLVPSNLPGDLEPVKWTGTFATDTKGLRLRWRWGAAVYTQFAGQYNDVGVKAIDGKDDANYPDSDRAGTPEKWEKFLAAGATGGGGHNYTGSLTHSKLIDKFNPPPSGKDTTPPTITASVSPIANGFTSTTPTVTAALADPGTNASGVNPATFKATLDGTDVTAKFTVTSSSATGALGTLANGAHTLVLSVSDNAGNNASVNVAVSVDATAPTISVAPPSGTITNASATFTVSYSDAGSGIDPTTFTATLDATSVTAKFSAGASQAVGTLTGLTQGAHTLVVQIKDHLGNQSQATVNFNVDVTPPTISPTVSPSVNGFTSTTPTVTATLADPGTGAAGVNPSTFKATLDGTDVTAKFTVTTTTATATLGPLANGAHTLVFSVSDNVGNSGSATSSINVDATAPTISIAPPSGTITKASATFTVSYSDAGSGIDPTTFAATLDGTSVTAKFSAGASQAVGTLTGLTQGAHSLVAQVKDRFGNQGQATVAFNTDVTPPTMTIAPTPGTFVTPSPTITVTYSDQTPGFGVDPTTFHASVDGLDVTGRFTPGAASATGTVGPLTDGPHTVVATVADKGGNVATVTATYNADGTAPTITFAVSPLSNGYTSANPTFTITLADTGAGVDTTTFKATIDGSAATFQLNGNVATATLGPLADGNHTLAVSVADRVGNLGSASLGVQVDATSPTIKFKPASGFTNATPTFKVCVADTTPGDVLDPTSFKATLDGKDVTGSFSGSASGSSAVLTGTLGPLAEGAHVLSVKVADVVGNVANQQATFTVDATAPAVTVTPANGATVTGTPSFALNYSDGGSGVDLTSVSLTLDGTALTIASQNATTTTFNAPANMAGGLHTLVTHVADLVANATNLTTTFTLTTANPATHFAVAISPGNPAGVAAGSVNDLTITALAQDGSTATTFTGNVIVSTSDGQPPLNGLVVPFAATDHGQVITKGVAIFSTLGNVTVTATSGTISGQLVVTVIGVANVSPQPLTAVAGVAGTSAYTVGVTPATATATLAISGTFATFGGGATIVTLGNGGTFTLTGVAVGTDTLTVTMNGVVVLTLGVSVSPGLTHPAFVVTATPEPENNPAVGAQSAYLSNGQTHLERVDLDVPGRGAVSFAFTRTYKSYVQYNNTLGFGWTHNYDMRLTRLDAQTIEWLTGTGRAEKFVQQGAGYASPSGWFVVLLGSDAAFTIRTPDGTHYAFNSLTDPTAPGMLASISDRHGNRMLFTYGTSGNGFGKLVQVKDAYDRVYTFAYDTLARIQSLTDFSGRTVTYKYSANGDLDKVTSPAVTQTTNGLSILSNNQFPNGKSEIYAYTNGQASALNHKMTLVVAPNEAAAVPDASLEDQVFLASKARLTNVWNLAAGANQGRLATQTWGGTNASGSAAGGTFTLTYTTQTPSGQDPINDAVLLTGITDRVGNVSNFYSNAAGQCVKVDQLTRGVRSLGGGLGQDPAQFETIHKYNADGLLTLTKLPLLNQVAFTYDSASPNRMSQANLLNRTSTPDARGDSRGGTTTRVATFVYEPVYNQLCASTDERGNDATYTPQNDPTNTRGVSQAARYTTTRFFDYQQNTATGNVLSSFAADTGLTSATLTTLLASAGVTLGLGDLNGDTSDDGFTSGDVVKVVAPSVTLTSKQTREIAAVGGTVQPIVTLLAHNKYGQPTSIRDAERNVSTFTYNASSDPDGDGIGVPGTTQNDSTGGYLATKVVDGLSDPARDSAQNPTPTSITTDLFYDTIGDVVSVKDGRGIAHQVDWSPTRQVVRTVAATSVAGAYLHRDQLLAALDYETLRIYDANANLIEVRVGNQGERDGSSQSVASNPYWSTKKRVDILDHAVVTIQEVTPIANDDSIDVTSTGVIVTHLAYDANENLIQITKPEGNAVVMAYDERDLVFTMTRGTAPTGTPASSNMGPDASTETRDYDANGNLQLVIDGFKNNTAKNTGFPGDVTQVVHDGFDRVQSVIDAESNSFDTVYDPIGNKVRLVRHGPTEESNPRLAEVAYLYDEMGRMFERLDNTYNYFASSLNRAFARTIPTTSSTPPAGESYATTLGEFDALGRAVRSVSMKGDETLADYDGVGRVVHAQSPIFTGANPNRNELFYVYDGNGDVIQVTDHERSTLAGVSDLVLVTDTVYDAAGRTTRVSDPMNLTTRFYYDSRSNLIDRTDARSTAQVVDPLGLKGPVTINGDGNVVRFYYDGASRRTRTETLMKVNGQGDGDPNLTTETNLDLTNSAIPTGVIVTSTTFDGNSRVAARTDANGNVTTLGYDSLDRNNAEIFADLSARTTQFDKDSNATQVTDPDGTIVQRSYDGINRVTNVNVTHMATNLAGTGQNVVGTTFQAFEWDGLSRVRTAIDDNGAAGTLGVAINYVYDSISRQLREQNQINCGVLANNVTTTNNRVTITPLSSTIDRTVLSDYATGTSAVTPVRMGIGYPQSNGVVSSVNVSIFLDGLCRPSSISTVPQGFPGLFFAFYNWLGDDKCVQRDVGFNSGTNVRTTTTYDQHCGCPIEIKAFSLQTDQVYFWQTLTYDASYNQTAAQRLDLTAQGQPSDTNQVDSGNRIVITSVSDPFVATYQYDGATNFVQRVEGGITTNYDHNAQGNYAFDILNRYTKLQTYDQTQTLTGTETPVHDTAGARIQDKTRHLYFDAFGRLVRVDRTFDGGATFTTVGTYTYDAFGRRATKQASVRDSAGNLVRTDNLAFVNDGPQEIQEIDLSTQGIVAQYIYDPQDVDQPLYMIRGTSQYVLDGDSHRSTYIATDATTGNLVERYLYNSVYGRTEVHDPGPIGDIGAIRTLANEIRNPFRFQGRKYDDESGLYYFRNRYLDPEEGRYVNRDPIGIWGDSQNNGNGYAFCGGNPVSRRDPFGLGPAGALAKWLVIGALVLGGSDPKTASFVGDAVQVVVDAGSVAAPATAVVGTTAVAGATTTGTVTGTATTTTVGGGSTTILGIGAAPAAALAAPVVLGLGAMYSGYSANQTYLAGLRATAAANAPNRAAWLASGYSTADGIAMPGVAVGVGAPTVSIVSAEQATPTAASQSETGSTPCPKERPRDPSTTVNLYYGTQYGYTSITVNGLSYTPPPFVTPQLFAALNAVNDRELNPSRPYSELDPGVITSAIPVDVYNQVFAPHVRPYPNFGFGGKLAGTGATEIELTSPQMVDVFNAYIVR